MTSSWKTENPQIFKGTRQSGSSFPGPNSETFRTGGWPEKHFHNTHLVYVLLCRYFQTLVKKPTATKLPGLRKSLFIFLFLMFFRIKDRGEKVLLHQYFDFFFEGQERSR